MRSNTKITVSGNCIEVLATEMPVLYGYKAGRRQTRNVDSARSKEIRDQSLKRSKKTLWRLINTNHFFWKKFLQTNYNPVFMTLTFRDNVQDLTFGNRQFSLFIQRLKNFLPAKNLNYVTVPEFQKRGAVHHHALFFDLPYVKNIYDEMRQIWGHGAVNVKSIRNMNYVASYVCKYMNKAMSDVRLVGRKSFFHSRSLLQPTVSKDDAFNIDFIKQLPNEYKTYEATFDDAYRKKVEYRKYELPYEHPLLQKIN